MENSSSEDTYVQYSVITPPTYLKDLDVEDGEIILVHLKVNLNFLEIVF